MLHSRNLIQLWVSKNKRFKTRKMTERPWNLDIVVYFSEKKNREKFFSPSGPVWRKNWSPENTQETISFFNRDTWNSTEVQPMRDRRSFPSAVVTEDEMYVLGGYDGNDTLRSVECYSFTTLEWTQVAPMGTPRSNAGACVFNSKIYLVGGWDGISLNSVECFDVGTRVWQRMPSLPRPTTGVRCCFLSFQSTNEQKPKSRGSRGHMCIICWWVWRYIWPSKLSWSKPFFKAVLFIIHVRS